MGMAFQGGSIWLKCVLGIGKTTFFCQCLVFKMAAIGRRLKMEALGLLCQPDNHWGGGVLYQLCLTKVVPYLENVCVM